MVASFAQRWRRKERRCGLAAIRSGMIACGVDSLPDSAAPMLTFKEAVRPTPISEVYGSGWSTADRKRLSSFRMIGSDGAGNPICLELDTKVVVLLDHEDWFRTRTFVNSSVRQLAECLLAYMGAHSPMRFRSAVRRIDPPAASEGAFWWIEAECLNSDR